MSDKILYAADRNEGESKQSVFYALFNHQIIESQRTVMESEFECNKIKDGLYLGNLTATQDYEFLQINKFAYIVNCSAQIPNYFDNHGLKYLKFKLIKERTHKLWDESLKKLRKLQKFIEEAEEQSLCCIISSAAGNNRSLVMLTAFLMSKYRWSLSKTLEYVRSKKIFIGLSEHYIEQLEILQSFLNQEQGKTQLSSTWKGPYHSEQEQLISKTYLNSQDLIVEQPSTKEKKERRVTWQDRIDKEKKKELKEQKMRQTGSEIYKKIRSSHKFSQEHSNPHNSISSKNIRHELVQSPLKKPEGAKKSKKVSKAPQSKKQQEQVVPVKEQFQEFKKAESQETGKQNKRLDEHRYFSQKELLKLLKNNLKVNKESQNKETPIQEQQNEPPKEGFYKLTINNFIAPNINIMNNLRDKTNTEKPSKSVKTSKKEEKNGRTHSEKETVIRQVNDSLKGKANKSYKRNTENSPKAREKKLQKAMSLQFKKNV